MLATRADPNETPHAQRAFHHEMQMGPCENIGTKAKPVCAHYAATKAWNCLLRYRFNVASKRRFYEFETDAGNSYSAWDRLHTTK